jgi:putative transposase
MPRLARAIGVDLPHHVTQRGCSRRLVLDTDTDRAVYLDLLLRASALQHLSLAGYCLMSNHVHLIATPRRPDALARALRSAHGRYAAYWNTKYGGAGHVWQARFYSCVLDRSHFEAALRYVELNPVRAGMVLTAEDYRWSSAAAHCGLGRPAWLDTAEWSDSWTPGTWREYLTGGCESEAEAIRTNTRTGRPLGSSEFLRNLEDRLGRSLVPKKGGRPRSRVPDAGQSRLGFEGQ